MGLAIAILSFIGELLPLIEHGLSGAASVDASADTATKVSAALGAITANNPGVDAHVAATAAHLAVGVGASAN